MPINTPETDQAIGAQEASRQGDFSVKNLPSPGALPLPQVPTFGTGQDNNYQNPNLEQNNQPVPGTNVSSKFLQNVLGTKEEPFKVGKLPSYTQDEVYNPRYNNFIPGADNEERAALNQSTWDKWGNAFVKFAATTVGTFYNGMTALPSTLNQLKSKNVYSDPNSISIDTWMNNLEDQFPNYYTKWEQAHPFISALPFVGTGGAANFWGDKFLKNLGFTVGAIASAAVTDFAIGAVTDGIGEIPLMGTQVGKIALGLNKIFSTGKVAALGEGVEASTDAILTAQNISRVSKLSKLADGTRYALNSYAAAASEAGFEARDGYNTVKNDLITAYKNDKGYAPFGQDADDIEKEARASANVRFGINLVLLGVSNAVQFDNLLKPWKVAQTGARSTIEKELGEAGKIGLAEGSLDRFQTIKGTRLANFYDKSRPYLADILSEGVYEEGGQYAAQVGTQNYYERKYIASHGLDKSGYAPDQDQFDKRNEVNEILHSTVKGMQAEFGTDEGLENIFLGALTGVVSKGAKAGYDRFTGHTDESPKIHREATLNLLNRKGVTDTLGNLYDSTVKSTRIAQDMKDAVKDGDLFKYKNYKHEMFSEFITSGLEAGRFDVRMEQLDLLKDMPQDKFKAAFGMDKTDDDVKTVSQYVDLMKQNAEKIKSTYDLIDDTFGNPFNEHSKDQQEINDHHTYEDYKNDLTYLASIQPDIKERQNSINRTVQKIDPRINTQILRTLTDRNSLKEYGKLLQDQATSAQKASELEGSATKVQDAAKAKDLQKKVDMVNSMLSAEKPSNAQFENMFRTLLSHELGNSEIEPNVPPELASEYGIPPEATPALIKYGVDSNRLTRYSQNARDSFEALTQQEGVDKYFDDKLRGDRLWRAKHPFNQEVTETNPLAEEPTQGTSPTGQANQQTPQNTQTPTPPKPTITATSEDGKKSRTFEQGKSYYLNTGREENGKVLREKAIVQSVNNDGTVTIKTENDEVKNVPIEQILKDNDIVTDINEVVADTSTPDTEIPPPDNDVINQTPKPETGNDGNGASKDISKATNTSVDPNYSDESTGFDRFQQRHQRFLWNLQSDDNETMNQENKKLMKAMYINKTLANKMGFPDNFIEEKKFTGDNEPIRIAYVIRKKGTSYFVDENGNQLTAINSGTVDANKVVFTTAVGPKVTNADGTEKWTNKQKLDTKKIEDNWIQKRRQILAVDNISKAKLMNFQVSRGIINTKNDNNRNPVVKVGLVKYSDLDRAILSVSTLGDITPRASGNISPILDSIAFEKGRTLLNPGLTVSWLDSRLLTDKEAENIYDLLRYIPEKKNKQELSTIVKYLRGVINMASTSTSGSSIKLAGMNLYLGADTENPVEMVREGLEANKERIIDFLKNAHHNVDKSRLEEKFDKNEKFNTLKIEKGNLSTDKSYDNYQHYLLSDKDGRDNPPLTSNLDVPNPAEGEKAAPPYIQKYIEVDNSALDSPEFLASSNQPQATPSPITSGKKDITNTPQSALIKLNQAFRTWFMGDMEGKPSSPEIERHVEQVVRDWNSKVADPASESFGEFVDRVIPEFARILNEEPDNTVITSHSRVLKVMKVWDEMGRPDIKNLTAEQKAEFSDKYNKESTDNGDIEQFKGKNGTIYVNRHGETEDNKKDNVRSGNTPLTELGVKQAKETGKKLNELTKGNIAQIISSDLPRAIHTSNLIAQAKTSTKEEIKVQKETGVKPQAPVETAPDNLQVLAKEAGVANIALRPYTVAGQKIYVGDLIQDAEGNVSSFKVFASSNTEGVTNKVPPGVAKVYEDLLMDQIKKSQITKDETNTAQPKKSLKDRLKDDGTQPRTGNNDQIQYRTVYSQGGSYEKIDVDKEYTNFKQLVGDKYTLNKVDHLLRKTNGGFAWGALQNSMVHIYSESPSGTLYHEAFEAVWGNYLTGKEQQGLYDEFNQRTGDFTTFNGEKKLYSQASVLEAKEQMADEFAEFRSNKDKAGESIKTSPKLVQWFNNLVNFIRKIIFGDKDEINRLYNRINQGYYRNYSNNITDINQAEYSTARAEQIQKAGLPESMVQDTISGMTVELMQQMFEDGSDLVEYLDERPKEASNILYNRLLDRLSNYYEGNAEGSLDSDTLTQLNHLDELGNRESDIQAIEQQYDQVKQQWDNIKKNWEGFVDEHKRYLRIFGVEFNVDDNGEVSYNDKEGELDEADIDNKSSTEYAKDYLTVDAKLSASRTIKLLLASIADSVWAHSADDALSTTDPNKINMRRDNSVVGLPKATQYAKLFNYILHTSANIGNIYDVLKTLQDRVSDPETRRLVDANVQRFLNKLAADKGFQDRSWANTKVLMKAEGSIVKNKPNYDRQFIDNQMNVYYKQSQLNTKLSQVKQSFLQGIKSSSIVQAGTGPEATIFRINDGVINKKNTIDFVQGINIPITKKEYRRFTSSQREQFNKAANAIRRVLERVARGNGILDTINNTANQDFDNRLTNLAEIYVESTGDDSQSQHPNLDNQQTSSFITNNFVTTMLNDFNNSKDKTEFLSKTGNGYMNDIFNRDSYLFNNVMFNPDGTKNQEVSFTIVEGLQSWNGNNVALSKVNEAIRSLIEINNNNKGTFYTLLPADAVTENAIKSGTFLNPKKFLSGTNEERDEEIDRFNNQMYSWLATEVALAKDFKTNKDRQNIVALNKELNGRKAGESLRFFQDIFHPELVDKINKEVIDGDKSIDELVDKTFFKVAMDFFISPKAENQIKYFKDWGILTDLGQNTLAVAGFDKEFLNTHFGENLQDTYEEGQIRNLMKFREMNYVISNIDMHKTFFGDPAQYTDELKRIKSFLSGRDLTHNDIYYNTPVANEGFNANANNNFNKAGDIGKDPNNTISLKPGDPGYKEFSNHFNTATIQDVFSASENENKDYNKNNEADSQAYIMPEAYRELMMKSAWRWTNTQENQYQRDMAWTRQEMEKDGLYSYTDSELAQLDEKLVKQKNDNNVAYQPLKIIHSGVQDVNGTAVSSIDKASWQMLNYKWFKDKNLGNLYVALQKKGIDYVRMESAHKVGIQSNSLTSLYDQKGAFNKEGIQGAKAEQVQLKHLGIQVEQNKKESGQTEGSQARKIVTMDLMNNGMPRDYGKTAEDWNRLDEREKEKASKLYAKVKRFDRAVSASVNNRVDSRMRKLGIKLTEDGTYRIEDKTAVSEFIFAELERRELPRNIAYGLEINPITKDFRIPLEANTQYQKIRQILYSTIEKSVQRPKFNGGQKTMVSATGFESGPRIVKEIIKTKNGDQTVYTSNLLKFYKEGKNGTEACQIMLPYYFEKKLLQAQKNGAPIKTKEQVLEYLKTDEGKELLKGIGFRIPTQGLNSLDFFEVKDFLPENMGDSVVFPAEITKKAGSDFDIDKMNLYIKNFYIDHNDGFPKVTKSTIDGKVDTTNEQAMKDYYEKYMLDDYRAQESERSSGKLLQAVVDNSSNNNQEDELEGQVEGDEDSDKDYVPSWDEFWLENRGKPSGEIGHREAIENEYMESMQDLLSDPINYDSLLRPNSADNLKKLRDDIVDLKESKQKQEDLIKNKPYGKLIDSQFMMKERQAYLSSKSVVGIAAIANTFHSLAQGVQGGLIYWGKPGFEARFPHNEINGKVSLSGLTIAGHSDVYISNVISQIIDGGVDVTKDKFLADMGINKETLPVVVSIIREGGSPRWAIHFINQPIIQEFLRQKEINKSIPQKISRRGNYVRSENNLAGIVKNTVNFNKPNMNMLKEGAPAQYSINEMKDMIKAENLTAEQRATQWEMLDDYRRYVNMGWDMFNYYSGYNWDTGNFGDPNMTRIKNLSYLRASDSKNLNMTPVNKMMEDTFLDTMRKGVWKLDNGFKSIINVQRGVAGQILTDFTKQMSSWFGAGMKVKQQALLKLELGMIDYSIQNSQKTDAVPLVDQISNLLLGHESTAHYVQALQNSGIDKLTTNPFIQNLQVYPDGRDGFPSTVKLKDRDYDTYTSNVWTDAFREMRENNTIIYLNEYDEVGKPVSEIFNMIAKTFMLENGGKRTSNSGTHLIPNETYGEYAKPAIDVMNLMNFQEVGSFQRNNLGDNWIIPSIEQETTDFQSGHKDWLDATGDIIRLIKQDKGENFIVPRLLAVGDWQAKGKQFVKRYNEATERTELYQRVNIEGLNGPEGFSIANKTSIYKPINTWGSKGNVSNNYADVQEHHQYAQPSILGGINPFVNELSDEYIVDLYKRAGIQSNAYILTANDAVLSKTKIRPEQSTPDELSQPQPAIPPKATTTKANKEDIEARRKAELQQAEEKWRGNVNERGIPVESLQPINERINAKYDSEYNQPDQELGTCK